MRLMLQNVPVRDISIVTLRHYVKKSSDKVMSVTSLGVLSAVLCVIFQVVMDKCIQTSEHSRTDPNYSVGFTSGSHFARF